jgi:transposase InsO family protein
VWDAVEGVFGDGREAAVCGSATGGEPVAELCREFGIYPLTVTDHASRYVLTSEALSSTREDLPFTVFERLFKERGLPANIRSDNGVPFAPYAVIERCLEQPEQFRIFNREILIGPSNGTTCSSSSSISRAACSKRV